MPWEAAISAAPGVDQAVTIGSRWGTLRNPAVTAMLRHRAATQDEVWAGSAPTALAASMMMAIVLPNPIRAAITAETTMDRRIGVAPEGDVEARPFRTIAPQGPEQAAGPSGRPTEPAGRGWA